GNRVGALLFAVRPLSFIPPATGRNHLLRLLAGIRQQPRQAERGPTDLAAALARAHAVIRRRALIMVVSDFLVPDGWQPALRRLAQRHEVTAVRLYDPRERELPDVGLITLEDPEDGNQLIVNTSDRKLRERYRQAAAAQAERLQAELARSGVDQFELSTDADLLPTLVRFLHTRRMRRAASVSR
ncbi:MAG TPA: VWA domain-containing protein, partial [Roseiflexaceae bacterium]|nr:VWA domain-containing protein [Roseiflexaceae bacterium]